ncbi:protein tyrosine phosphatase [Helcobacillus massiliensis]|uniref:protein-tyrosine-phosphatase n=1 Tax=Helcobacillus massiliensis TaxID=521392 RepID=A0A839QZG0_9MICO|nr:MULTISPECIES: protein tyrosine phosphatase [Helcobacillus]MBB3023341.1 protein-tyrosine phosphatase [Helcobacillus massiliensis]MCG7426713.1 protein tyrosine phosphatase [Helcobacillus sp. ACRRO]MCT1557674.1 protein tyrosine phosphatase [Helcobacillus massiliensis]MCT2035946.1 protein tyrosine phosphatase [Helcobacillus massiliensis]MCT2331784.1 protein tyrosine phosphatase [Helcobacillus massiliensis]
MNRFRVLTVCTANVCRSPAAAAVLAAAVDEAGLSDSVEVGSAGTTWEAEGMPMDDRTAAALQRAGHRADLHAARTVHVNELAQWDLVLAMTLNHRETLQRQVEAAPELCAGTEVRMWGAFDPAMPEGATGSDLDVPDPWYEDDPAFDEMVARLERAVPSLLDAIRSRLD